MVEETNAKEKFVLKFRRINKNEIVVTKYWYN